MVLTRHFIDQAIGNDVFGSTADARRWSLGVVGLLGLVGAVAAMLLLPDARTAPLADPEVMRAFSRPDRLMAIVAAMVGSGLLSCAIWPAMVFDRRDVEVLIGLPLSAPGIVQAKLSALCTIVLVFSCGTQLPAAFVFGQTFDPSMVMSLYTAAVHLLVQVAAGVFVFFFIASTQAVALMLLGPPSFLKLSAAVQATLTALVVAAVTYAPDLYYGVSAGLRIFGGPVPPWLAHGPLAWFLGAYDVLLGSREVANLHQAVNAIVALGACVVVTLVIYPVMFHRLARLAIEHGKRHQRRRTALFHIRLDRVSRWIARPSTMLRAPRGKPGGDRTTHAASVFVLLSLMRSLRHRQMLAVAFGLAAAYCVPSILRWWPHLAAPPIQPPAELLSLPIEAIFILVGGLLLATCLPTEPGSRWVWRATEPDRRSLRSAVRRVTFLVGVVPVVAIATPVYWFGWGGPARSSRSGMRPPASRLVPWSLWSAPFGDARSRAHGRCPGLDLRRSRSACGTWAHTTYSRTGSRCANGRSSIRPRRCGGYSSDWSSPVSSPAASASARRRASLLNNWNRRQCEGPPCDCAVWVPGGGGPGVRVRPKKCAGPADVGAVDSERAAGAAFAPAASCRLRAGHPNATSLLSARF